MYTHKVPHSLRDHSRPALAVKHIVEPTLLVAIGTHFAIGRRDHLKKQFVSRIIAFEVFGRCLSDGNLLLTELKVQNMDI